MSFVAVIDPNWATDEGGGGRGAGEHYDLATPSKIAEGYYAARDDAGRRIWPQLNTREPMLVFMWATAGAMAQPDAPPHNGQGDMLGGGGDDWNPPAAYVLARLLGLRVCASTVWCKVDIVYQDAEDDLVAYVPPARMGIGQWTRCEDERLLICRRGSVPIPDTASRPRSVIYAPRVVDANGAVIHSAKPPEAWTQVIEPIARSSMPGVVGVEFNARMQRAGWAAVGRLDGESNPVRFARASCQHVSRDNDDGTSTCVRCGATLHGDAG